MSVAEWCAKYRALGWKVLPLHDVADKNPREEGWPTRDSLEVSDCEAGTFPALSIQTGPVSGLLVLDCDELASTLALRKLLADLGAEEWTIPIQKTQRGFHFLFRWPEDWPDQSRVHFGKLKLGGTHADVRGWHGHICAQPALNKIWIQGPWAPPPMPLELIGMLTRGGARRDDRDPTDLRLSDEVLESLANTMAKYEAKAEDEHDGSSTLMKRTAHAVLGMHVYDADDFVHVMARWNAKRGDDLFDEDTLRAAHADVMARKQEGENREIFRPIDLCDEYHAARRLLFYVGRDCEITADSGAVWTYDANVGIWQPIEGAELHNTVGWRLSKHPAFTVTGKPTVLTLSQKAIQSIALRALEEASSSYGTGYFEDAPIGIALLEGFLTLRDGRACLVPHSPENRARTLLSVAYDPAAKSDRWERFLDDSFAGADDADARREILQMFAGAGLFGLATRYEKCLVLQGEGENGKSVWTEVVSALFPARARSAVEPSAWNDLYSLMGLRHSRWNVVEEMPGAKLLNSSSFKKVISGQTVRARDPYFPVVEFRPQAAHVMNMNRLPPTDEPSHGFFRRVMLVPFPNQVPAERRDVRLAEKLKGEALGAVLAWAVAGAEKLVARNGYGPGGHDASEQIDEWRASTDQCMDWLSERTLNRGGVIPDDVVGEWIGATTLYNDYRMWALGAGHKNVFTRKRFCMQLAALGVSKRKAEVGNLYFVALRAIG